MQQIMRALCWKGNLTQFVNGNIHKQESATNWYNTAFNTDSEVHGQWDRGQSLTALHLSTGDVHIANVA